MRQPTSSLCLAAALSLTLSALAPAQITGRYVSRSAPLTLVTDVVWVDSALRARYTLSEDPLTAQDDARIARDAITSYRNATRAMLPDVRRFAVRYTRDPVVLSPYLPWTHEFGRDVSTIEGALRQFDRHLAVLDSLGAARRRFAATEADLSWFAYMEQARAATTFTRARVSHIESRTAVLAVVDWRERRAPLQDRLTADVRRLESALNSKQLDLNAFNRERCEASQRLEPDEARLDEGVRRDYERQILALVARLRAVRRDLESLRARVWMQRGPAWSGGRAAVVPAIDRIVHDLDVELRTMLEPRLSIPLFHLSSQCDQSERKPQPNWLDAGERLRGIFAADTTATWQQAAAEHPPGLDVAWLVVTPPLTTIADSLAGATDDALFPLPNGSCDIEGKWMRIDAYDSRGSKHGMSLVLNEKLPTGRPALRAPDSLTVSRDGTPLERIAIATLSVSPSVTLRVWNTRATRERITSWLPASPVSERLDIRLADRQLATSRRGDTTVAEFGRSEISRVVVRDALMRTHAESRRVDRPFCYARQPVSVAPLCFTEPGELQVKQAYAAAFITAVARRMPQAGSLALSPVEDPAVAMRRAIQTVLASRGQAAANELLRVAAEEAAGHTGAFVADVVSRGARGVDLTSAGAASTARWIYETVKDKPGLTRMAAYERWRLTDGDISTVVGGVKFDLLKDIGQEFLSSMLGKGTSIGSSPLAKEFNEQVARYHSALSALGMFPAAKPATSAANLALEIMRVVGGVAIDRAWQNLARNEARNISLTAPLSRASHARLVALHTELARIARPEDYVLCPDDKRYLLDQVDHELRWLKLARAHADAVLRALLVGPVHFADLEAREVFTRDAHNIPDDQQIVRAQPLSDTEFWKNIRLSSLAKDRSGRWGQEVAGVFTPFNERDLLFVPSKSAKFILWYGNTAKTYGYMGTINVADPVFDDPRRVGARLRQLLSDFNDVMAPWRQSASAETEVQIAERIRRIVSRFREAPD